MLLAGFIYMCTYIVRTCEIFVLATCFSKSMRIFFTYESFGIFVNGFGSVERESLMKKARVSFKTSNEIAVFSFSVHKTQNHILYMYLSYYLKRFLYFSMNV